MIGMVIAIAIKRPEFALPAAFLSHFAVDMLPHWNLKVPGYNGSWRSVALTDALAAISIIVILSALVPHHSWLVFFGGLLAALPDSMWLPHALQGEHSPRHEKKLLHILRHWHSKIQWSESTTGIAVEVFWFVLMFLLFIRMTIY